MKKITPFLALAMAMMLGACGGNTSSSTPSPSPSSDPTPASSDPIPSSSDPTPSSSEPVSSEPASSEPAPSSSEPVSSEPASSEPASSTEPVARRLTQDDVTKLTKAYDEATSYTLVIESTSNLYGVDTVATMTLKFDGRKAQFTMAVTQNSQTSESTQTQSSEDNIYYEMNEEGTAYDRYEESGETYGKTSVTGTEGYPDILYGVKWSNGSSGTLAGSVPVDLLTSEAFSIKGTVITSSAPVYFVLVAGADVMRPELTLEAPTEQVTYNEYKDHVFNVDGSGTLLSGTVTANTYARPGQLWAEGSSSFSFKDVGSTSVTLPTV